MTASLRTLSFLPPLPALLFAAAPVLADDEAFPSATPESQGLSSEALDALAAEVAGFVERDLALGGELLVVKNRHTVLHRWFGVADREGDEPEPWIDGTVCNIRSMTKPLTGAAAQILIDRGKLALDDPVAKYLLGFDTDRARAHPSAPGLVRSLAGPPVPGEEPRTPHPLEPRREEVGADDRPVGVGDAGHEVGELVRRAAARESGPADDGDTGDVAVTPGVERQEREVVAGERARADTHVSAVEVEGGAVQEHRPGGVRVPIAVEHDAAVRESSGPEIDVGDQLDVPVAAVAPGLLVVARLPP